MFIIVNYIIMILCALMAMTFFTLLEQKVLGYSQLRKGPNKNGFIGVTQPINDAMKLFSKEKFYPQKSNFYLFNFSSFMVLFIALFLWLINPIHTNTFINFSIMFLLCLSSLNVYCVLFSSWSSNSKYSLLGAMRNIAQMISYEISLFLILIVILSQLKSMMIYEFYKENFMILFFYLMMILTMWMISMLAELGRAPLDFNEGESELVSGFNTEYGGALFAFIFMGEYLNVIFIMIVTKLIFFTSIFLVFSYFENLFLMMFVILMLMFILLIRSSYPRFRYDMLMILTWKLFLPLSILNLMIFFCLCSSIKNIM